jgi:alkylation response protein AidB-like acyl-CoA dehydrogenase
LFDMETPGVSTRPIVLISGKSPFCETFFEDVKVPRRNVVGELNAGWTIAKYLLTHEREMIGGVGERSSAKPLARFAVDALGRDEQGRLPEPVLRSQIARFEIDEAAFRLLMQATGDRARLGEGNPAMSSALKYYGAELNKRRWELMISAAGADGLEWEGERSHDGAAVRTWLRTKGNSIEGGTSEIQLNVVAKRILGLPGA